MRTPRSHPFGRSSDTTAGAFSPDAGPGGLKGRGAGVNPASRFESISLSVLPAGGGQDDLLFE
ncbi:MAG: hypothetical protein JNK58_00560, partial [Phycisphaerae bacterium]|nr:hypothetical protein [Phycisphaerae bacterium]